MYTKFINIRLDILIIKLKTKILFIISNKQTNKQKKKKNIYIYIYIYIYIWVGKIVLGSYENSMNSRVVTNRNEWLKLIRMMNYTNKTCIF